MKTGFAALAAHKGKTVEVNRDLALVQTPEGAGLRASYRVTKPAPAEGGNPVTETKTAFLAVVNPHSHRLRINASVLARVPRRVALGLGAFLPDNLALWIGRKGDFMLTDKVSKKSVPVSDRLTVNPDGSWVTA